MLLAKTQIPSASIGGRDVSASPLLNTQQLASTRNCTEMSVSDLSDEEASTRSTINFTGPVTRQRAKVEMSCHLTILMLFVSGERRTHDW